jgi:hypothetical protein
MKRITLSGTLLLSATLLTGGLVWADVDKAEVTPWQYDILSVDIPGFEPPCLDESLRIVADWQVRWREVRTPSGGDYYTFQYTPSTPAGGGHYVLIGESSGTVYHSQNGMPAHEMIHVGPGEQYHFRSHERYVSEDGTRLTIDWHIVFIVNAKGQVSVDFQLLNCRVQ